MIDIMINLKHSSSDYFEFNQIIPSVAPNIIKIEESFIDFIMEFATIIKNHIPTK